MPPLPRKAAPTRKKRAKPKAAAPKSPGLAAYAGSTVRPHEEGSRTTRYRQNVAAELVMRFCKYVAVCQSRQAAGVASAKIGVFRRVTSTRTYAWDTRRISHKELTRQRRQAGPFTRKNADMADEVEEITDPLHPIVALLANANAIMNGYRLFEQTQLGIGLTGDAYWHIVTNGDGTPVEAWPLAPQFVRPLPSREMIVSAYVYGRGTEVEREIPAEEVIRFTQTNPRGDPFKGFGDLEKCIDAADLSIAFDQYRLNTIDNGAQPGIIAIDKKGGIEQRQQLEDQLNRKFSGVRNVGRSMVLTGEVEIAPWGMNEKESAFLNSDAAVRETIANCHDYPSALMTLDGSALATAKVAVQHWQEFGRKPRCDRIADVLNQRLVPMFAGLEGGEDIYVCFENVVDRDLDLAAVRMVSMYTADLVTKNEARSELDYDAVPDGDKFKSEVMQEQFEANAKLGTTLGTGAAGGDAGGKPPVDSGGDGADAADESAKPAEKTYALGDGRITIINTSPRYWNADGTVNGHAGTEAVSIPRVPVVAVEPISQKSLIISGPAMTCCPNHPRNMRKDAAIDAITLTERQLEAVIRGWFASLTSPLAAKMTPHGLPSDAEKVIALSLEGVIHGPLNRIYLHGWNFGVQELGPAAGQAKLMAALTGQPAAYLREFQGKLIRSVSDTVDSAIREELATGIEAGESIPQLTSRLKTSIDGMSGVGAERIARTETARAFMASREKSWQESGNVWGKRWQLAPDACQFCVAAASEFGVQKLGVPFFEKGTVLTGSLGESMTLDYSDVDGPPLHPNDRCSLVMVMEEPK